MSVRPKRKISLRELDENFNESDINDLNNDPNFSPNEDVPDEDDEDLHLLHQLILDEEQEHQDDLVGESVETQFWEIWTGKEQRFPYTDQGD